VDVECVRLVTDVMVGVEELLHVLSSPGDGVVVNVPCYPPYFDDIPHAGRRVVPVALRDDWSLDLDGIEAAFSSGARALLLCNPHNPSGRLVSRADLVALAALADAYDAVVISDEIHAPLTLPGFEFVPWLTVSARGAAVTSASKAFNLAGLKVGLVVGEPARSLSEDLRFRAGYLGAIASEVAFRECDPWLDEVLGVIAANHAALPSLLPAGITAVPAEASYLAWLDCRGVPSLGDDPASVFLSRGRVALSSGPEFGPGGAGFARLNVGTRPELVKEAVRRLAAALTR
jgi:cystathionine beta-lyase